MSAQETAETIDRGLREGWLRIDTDKEERSVPPHLNVVGYEPRLSTAGTTLPAKMRLVHVMSKPAGGEIRGYALIDGRAYLRLPNYANYAGEWPELDAAVSKHLGVEVVS